MRCSDGSPSSVEPPRSAGGRARRRETVVDVGVLERVDKALAIRLGGLGARRQAIAGWLECLG